MWSKTLVAVGVLLASGACLSVTTVNIGTKTSLERQLIGELEPYSEEELLAASVRVESKLALGSLEELQMRALAARRRQLFNRDDLDELKAQGCLGEGRAAALVVRPCETGRNPEIAERLRRLAREENEDRGVIIDWAVQADAALTPADRPEVVGVYHRLLVEQARPGEWVEAAGGGWERR